MGNEVSTTRRKKPLVRLRDLMLELAVNERKRRHKDNIQQTKSPLTKRAKSRNTIDDTTSDDDYERKTFHCKKGSNKDGADRKTIKEESSSDDNTGDDSSDEADSDYETNSDDNSSDTDKEDAPSKNKDTDQAVKRNKFVKLTPGIEYISNVKAITNVCDSVGILACRREYFGTGFAVGETYIMTALHVVQKMLGLNWCSGITLKTEIKKQLKKSDARVIFNYEHQVQTEYLQFFFSDEFAYIDKAHDVAVLKVIKNFDEKKEAKTMFPKSFHNFGNLKISQVFEFIGHHGGMPKARDIHCRTKTFTRKEIDLLTNELKKQYRKYCSPLENPYAGIFNSDRDLFDCSFEHSGSGSPGIQFDVHGDAYVCTMLTGGYPTFYWDIEDKIKVYFDKKYRAEYGIKMSAIYEQMKATNERLCSRIFKKCKW